MNGMNRKLVEQLAERYRLKITIRPDGSIVGRRDQLAWLAELYACHANTPALMPTMIDGPLGEDAVTVPAQTPEDGGDDAEVMPEPRLNVCDAPGCFTDTGGSYGEDYRESREAVPR